MLLLALCRPPDLDLETLQCGTFRISVGFRCSSSLSSATCFQIHRLMAVLHASAGVRFGVAYNVVIMLGVYQLCTCGLLGAHKSPGPAVR